MGTYVAKGTFNDAIVSDADKATIASLKQAYADAKAAGNTDAMNAAHNAAEAIRYNYNYSGGTDGSENLSWGNNQQTTQSYTPVSLYNGTSAATNIENYYQAAIDSAIQALKTAYDKNSLQLDETESSIGDAYQSARNQSAANAEIAKQNMNEYFAANGLNNGAAGQMQLSTSAQAQSDQNSLNLAEANARKQLAFDRQELYTTYQNEIAQAIKDGNTEKANALYQDYVRLDNAMIDNSYKEATLNYQYDALAQDQSQFDQSMNYNYEKLSATGDGETVTGDTGGQNKKDDFISAVLANRTNNGNDDDIISQWKYYGFNSEAEAIGYLGAYDSANFDESKLGANARGFYNRAVKDSNWVTSVQNAYDNGLLTAKEVEFLLNQV